ncbi:uncharacterized protein Bfra_001215 [Botrytis fragariae]|uniref:Uncharacterized protein n=1 Tax=Botrytis fragariae TaxID=1964551 RepID=A0A8H6B0F4_9HELO|nr:uncharacterized protein Bfra_001215 [Botrytis fragariae]KAF5876860.1 hypothetical protein Bfra_001215 [Botrytis fragariae]
MVCANFNNAIVLFVISTLAFLSVAQSLSPIPSPESVATTLHFSSGSTDSQPTKPSRTLITSLVIITGGFEPTVTLTIVAPAPTSTVSYTSTSISTSILTSTSAPNPVSSLNSTTVTAASSSASVSNSVPITGSSSTSTPATGTQTKSKDLTAIMSVSNPSNNSSPTQSSGLKSMDSGCFLVVVTIALGLLVILEFFI